MRLLDVIFERFECHIHANFFAELETIGDGFFAIINFDLDSVQLMLDDACLIRLLRIMENPDGRIFNLRRFDITRKGEIYRVGNLRG